MTQNTTQPAAHTIAQTAYQALFDHLNVRLFGGGLSHVILNFSRHAKAYGFFAPSRWHRTASEIKIHEISLNPIHLSARTLEASAATLAHEMAHAWDHDHGKPGRGGYHGKSWARKMKEIGLHPSDTAAPGGKETGQKVSHYIVAGGAFALAFAEIPEICRLPFVCSEPTSEAKRKAKNKIKYTCGECEANAWGKPGLRITCEECGVPFDPPAEDKDGENKEV